MLPRKPRELGEKGEKASRELVVENEKLRERVAELEEKARQQAAERDAQLHQVIDLVRHMVFAKDVSGRFLLANKAHADAYGTTVEALIGTSHAEHHPDDEQVKRMLSDDAEVIRSGKARFIPHEEFVDARGHHRILQTTKVPFTLAGHDGPAILGVAVDITEITRARALQTCRTRALDCLSSDTTLEEVLTVLVEAVEEVHPETRASVMLLDEERRHLKLVAAPRLPADYNTAIDGLEIGPTVGSCGASAATGVRVIAEDVLTHPNWAGFHEYAEQANFRACWSEPIVTPHSGVLGTFAMYYEEPRKPGDEEAEFIRSMAHIAGIAIERKRTESALTEGEERYRTLVENAPEAIVLLDVDEMRFVEANENAVDLFQLEREELYRRGPAELGPTTQPGGPTSEELARRYVREALEGGSPIFEWIHRDTTGADIPCEVRLVRFPSSKRRLVRGSITDISERKREEDRQQRVHQELDHRVKNILATVQAIAEQTLESTSTQHGFAVAFRGRISSLARAHEALAQRKWEGASLGTLVNRSLAPYRGEDEGRVRIEGEEVLLRPETVQPISMALHELATNAAKYGALSVPGGSVDVRWYVRRGADKEVRLTWTERGGPPVSEPSERGIGLNLIERGVGYEIGGLVKIGFDEAGLTCEIRVSI